MKGAVRMPLITRMKVNTGLRITLVKPSMERRVLSWMRLSAGKVSSSSSTKIKVMAFSAASAMKVMRQSAT